MAGQFARLAQPIGGQDEEATLGDPIGDEGELLALGERFKLIGKSSGSVYVYGEEKLGRGYDAARTTLRENKKLAKEIEKKIRHKLETGGLAYEGKSDPEEAEAPTDAE